MNKPLQAGDRVIRAGKEQSDPPRRGVVERAYESMPNGVGVAVQLYAVRWDDKPKEVVPGYLFLELEPLVIA